MTVRRICTWDRQARLYRLVRFTWGTETNAHQFTIAFRPRLFQWHTEFGAWFLTVAGIRIHLKSSRGGRFAP